MKISFFSVLTIFFMASFCLMTGNVLAVGEAFQIETSGTEYCGDFYSIKFNAKNNVNLWVYLQSESDIIVSFTPDFQSGTTFLISLFYYLVSNKKLPSLAL
jgi:hypothetical protein